MVAKILSGVWLAWALYAAHMVYHAVTVEGMALSSALMGFVALTIVIPFALGLAFAKWYMTLRTEYGIYCIVKKHSQDYRFGIPIT